MYTMHWFIQAKRCVHGFIKFGRQVGNDRVHIQNLRKNYRCIYRVGGNFDHDKYCKSQIVTLGRPKLINNSWNFFNMDRTCCLIAWYRCQLSETEKLWGERRVHGSTLSFTLPRGGEHHDHIICLYFCRNRSLCQRHRIQWNYSVL